MGIVVVGVDGSGNSRGALDWALAEASLSGSVGPCGACVDDSRRGNRRGAVGARPAPELRRVERPRDRAARPRGARPRGGGGARSRRSRHRRRATGRGRGRRRRDHRRERRRRARRCRGRTAAGRSPRSSSGPCRTTWCSTRSVRSWSCRRPARRGDRDGSARRSGGRHLGRHERDRPRLRASHARGGRPRMDPGHP